jgi:hypothetical protein
MDGMSIKMSNNKVKYHLQRLLKPYSVIYSEAEIKEIGRRFNRSLRFSRFYTMMCPIFLMNDCLLPKTTITKPNSRVKILDKNAVDGVDALQYFSSYRLNSPETRGGSIICLYKSLFRSRG